MSISTSACPSCATPLPEGAAFCFKCGRATPAEIDVRQGEVAGAPETSDSGWRAQLQEALGETYEVRRLLGRGGFAEVYVAYDKRLKREIAVKTLRSDIIASASLLERFQREAEAVAQLRHPNIVPIYSVGAEGGLAYYTMPLIDGESLASMLEREGRLGVEEACRILREAALGLQAAHRAGIVHRDVKPENIMLEGPERSVVVMDFGIAKTAAPEAGGGALTGTGMLIGTPQYMSPEQAMGERELDHRSDQYSLAIVGYRMLTGRLPFEGDSAQTQIYKAVTEVPPPLADVVPDVPKHVSDAIARALAKRPGDRFESMQAFAAALELNRAAPAAGGIVRRRPGLAARAAAMRASLPGRRHPALWITPVVLVLAVVVGVRTTPRPVIALADGRDDALFAARSFLATRTDAAGRSAYASPAHNDRAYQLLVRQLGPDSAQRRAERDVTVWEWVVKLPGRTAGDHWQVSVGSGNRVTAFRHVVADSAPAATVSADSARRVAEREVVARGSPLERLQRLPDSTIVRKARTDYRFRWRVKDGAVAWRGADTAYTRLDATVIGGRVESYAERFIVPESFGQRSTQQAVAFTIVLLVVALIAGAITIAMKRQRVDELQWRPMLRLVGVAVMLLLLARVDSLSESLATGAFGPGTGNESFSQQMINMLVMGILFIGPVLCAAVVGESLAAETRPSVTAGLDDLARGRVAIPELVPAAIRGYAIGAVLALLAPLVTFASLRVPFGEPRAPDLPYGGVPVLGQLYVPGLWLLGVLLFLFIIVLAARVRVIARFAPVVPAAFMLLIVMMGSSGLPTLVEAAATVLVLSWALWHYDLLTALVAAVSSGFVGFAVAFLQSGNGRYVAGGVVMVAFFLAPAAAALVAHRRATRLLVVQSPSRGGSTPATPLTA